MEGRVGMSKMPVAFLRTFTFRAKLCKVKALSDGRKD